MEFDLTDELIKQIAFAMENQTELFLFDSEEKLLIKKEDLPESYFLEEKDSDSFIIESQIENRYYILPEWNSILGFKMMEKFVSILHNPLARLELKQVLALRKGVFRNFKDTLSEYPEVEKIWYNFKDNEMKKLVLDWYNRHREAWGLDLLPVEFDETESLILEDFLFRLTSFDEEAALIESCQKEFLSEILDESRDQNNINEVLAFLWKSFQYSLDQKESKNLFVVETIEKDFAGLAVFFQLPTSREKTLFIPFVYVDKRFRGLGLGNELLQAIIGYAKKQMTWKLVAHNAFIPDVFSRVLLRNGFEKINGVFFASLLDSLVL